MRILFFYQGENSASHIIAKLLAKHCTHYEIVDCLGWMKNILPRIYRFFIRKKYYPSPSNTTISISNIFLNKFLSKNLREKIEVFDPDIVISLVGFSFIRNIIGENIPLIYWYIDAPMSVTLNIAMAKVVDRMFIITPDLIEFYSKYCGYVDYLPLACDSELFKPNRKVEETIDVVYVGNYSLEKKLGFKYYLYPLLSTDLNVQIYGKGWYKNRWFKSFISYEDIPKLYAKSKIILNIHMDRQRDLKYCFNMRLYEGMACGKPVVTDFVKGMDKKFSNYKNLVWVSTENIVDVVKNLVEDKDLRKSIGIKARKRIYRETYRDRLLKMLD